MLPRPTIEAFDAFLATLGLRFEGVVIGGSALALLGVIDRPTRDFDILVPTLPPAIADAARQFAQQQQAQGGIELSADWLNNGPLQLAQALPAKWRERTRRIFSGTALTLDTLDRPDLLKSKLFALCDRGIDIIDCVALAPTNEELTEALPWLLQQDQHPQWPTHVRDTIDDLVQRLAHGI